MTVQELKSAFVYVYKEEAEAVYFVPGKINLIAEHIAEFENIDLQPTLSCGIYLLLRKNNVDCFKFWSLNEPEAINWKINQPIPKNINSWIKYTIGIIKQFVEMGFEKEIGYDLLFWGNIPKGADLLPSEGLELITTFALKDQLPNIQSSTLNQQITNHGLSYINRNIIPNELVSEITDTLFKKTEGYKVVISNTHTPHKVDASSYYQRMLENKSAVEYLNKIQPIYNWDELTEVEFNGLVSTINNPEAIKSVYHMISEVHRTKIAIEVLKKADYISFGHLMNASHSSLRDNLEIVSPEVDAMVAEALKIEGVLGSRMAGCGFGGCTISLVKEEALDIFIKKVGRVYEEETGIKNNFFVAEIGDCACKLYQ
ncbi:MAG: galactokinase [Paludibacter sp.]